MSERIDVALLGPVEVRVDGEAVPITSLSQRVLVARLAMSPDRAVSVPELVNSLWVNDRRRTPTAICRATCRGCGALSASTG